MLGRITCWCGCEQDVGALGHEVHATEHEEIGFGSSARPAGELERVAAQVGVADDLVALVVVTQDHELAAECFLAARMRASSSSSAHLLIGGGQLTGSYDRLGDDVIL